MILRVLLILVVLLPFDSDASNRPTCDAKKQTLLREIQDSNRCNEDDDCGYIEVVDCSVGCMIEPVNKWLNDFIKFQARDYKALCGGDVCNPPCERVLSSKCVKGRCQIELRDWKYITKTAR